MTKLFQAMTILEIFLNTFHAYLKFSIENSSEIDTKSLPKQILAVNKIIAFFPTRKQTSQKNILF